MEGKREYQVCTKCVMDTTDSKIVFDENGVCDHCHNFEENIRPNWKYATPPFEFFSSDGKPLKSGDITPELERVLEKIRSEGKNKKYDCLIGLSGGVDSSFLTYCAVKKWGLRPLIYSVDTCWNLPVAEENVKKLIDFLGVDIITEKIDHDSMMDLQLAFFKSQVSCQDIPQDHLLFAALYNYAAANGFKYVLTGGNNSCECVREPNEWVHENDLRLIKDIHKRFGRLSDEKLNYCGMFKYRLFYRYFKGVKAVKVLDYVPYIKQEVIDTLKAEIGWVPYKNKHYEDIFTRFYEGYWLPKKFGYDKRRCHFSSLILTGQLSRDEALKILAEPPYDEATALEDMAFITKELGITTEEFIELMNGENKSYKDYKNGFGAIHMARNLAKLVGIERRNIR